MSSNYIKLLPSLEDYEINNNNISLTNESEYKVFLINSIVFSVLYLILIPVMLYIAYDSETG